MTKVRYKKYRYPGVRQGRKPGIYVVDYIDHNGKRHQKTFHGAESDAARYRRALLAKVDRIKAGLEAPPGREAAIPTLADLWELFGEDRQLRIRAGNMSERSLERCGNSYDALIEYDSSLETRLIDNIRLPEFETFKVYRKELGFSPEGVNLDLRNLKTLFNFAVKRGYLAVSPLAEVSPIRSSKSDVRFLDEDELKSLYVAMTELSLGNEFHRDARDLTEFYLFTGARLSEALYPTFDWSCVGQQAIHFPRTKSSKSRTIPMTDTVKDVLEGRRHIPGGPFHFNRDRVYSRVKMVFDKAGITDASPHTLRKTAGAWYYMATRDIFATSRFLGHSSVTVTEQHYAGLIESLRVEYAKQFDDLLSSRLQLGCNSETKPDPSRPIAGKQEVPDFSSGASSVVRSGPSRIRTWNRRIMSPAL